MLFFNGSGEVYSCAERPAFNFSFLLTTLSQAFVMETARDFPPSGSSAVKSQQSEFLPVLPNLLQESKSFSRPFSATFFPSFDPPSFPSGKHVNG